MKSQSDAEDAAQETFLKLVRYEPVLDSEEYEKAWIIRTTINICKDLLKSKWRHSVIGIDQVPEREKKNFQVPFVENDETIWTVLKLREPYRNPIYLFYYEDYSIREIADIENIPENTVKTYLRRGREELKKMLS